MCRFSDQLDKYLGAWLLDLVVTLEETAKLSSKVTAPVCIPISTVYEVQSLCITVSIWDCQFSFGFDQLVK